MGWNPTRTLLALTLAAAAAGCGADEDDLVAPGASPAPVEAALVDDPVRIGGEAEARPTLTGQVSILLSTDGETWVPVGAPERLELLLQTGDTAIVASDPAVESGTYERIRLVFRQATVTLETGADLDGTVFDIPLVLSLGEGGEAVVEKRVDAFAVGGGASAHLLLELNSAAWVNAGTARAGRVSAAELQAATRVRVRGEGAEG